MQNPDRRPLPNGWTEHYDSSRNNWYYVQINATPPRASYQHPADLEPDRSQTGPSGGFVAPPPPPPPPFHSGMPTPSVNGKVSQQSGSSGLSLAQRLYASSNSTEPTPTMISASARDFGRAPTPLAHPIQTPASTPSPSVSPSSGSRSSPTFQTIPRAGDPRQIPSMPAPNAADFYNSKLGFNSFVNSRSAYSPVSTQSGSSQYGSTGNGFPSPYPANDSPEAPALQAPPLHAAQSYQVPPPPSFPTGNHAGSTNNGFTTPYPANANSEAPAFQPPHLHRAQSYQVPPPPPLPTDLHRSATYPANISARSSSSAGPPSTPHLSTTAQAPSQSANASGSIPHFQTMLSPPSLSQLPSPPYSEETFNSSMGYPPPPLSFHGVQPMVGRGGSTTSPPISPADAAQSAALAAQAAQRAKILKQVGLSVGKTAGKAALKIAGSAALLSVGIPPGLAIGFGKSILNSNAVGALVNAVTGANTGVDQSTLQAVIQGQPGADYQGIINALKLQQQQQQQANLLQSQGLGLQPQAPPVDYQALIAELTRIQLLAAAQQQAVAQQQAPSQQQALAQLQAAALLQQQSATQQQAAQQQQAFAQLQVAALLQQQQQQQQQAALQQQIAAQTRLLEQQQQQSQDEVASMYQQAQDFADQQSNWQEELYYRTLRQHQEQSVLASAAIAQSVRI
ncbi:hypothetical protein K443DRAFT_683493 [Laccaria amethystina LaAM-08-1]|uniref:Unplaced genomic scaffold K443scaffold_243, whole genome shotgun sequence n=1 Tax=Laccaria amethystina LaAM-08-1 TaxID=1095629 RepID=A0A0C9XAQ2_9AGAR|nr:hypothetical protein K443DRAFT_683493 [Laccaria amethystina LaAM-08-1]